jgi:uncharacterized protein involved in outer membrane biogenesis
MKNWRKAGLWAAGVVALLVAGCAIALKVMVDPERLKQMARERVQAATGRELRVEEMSLRFVPVPSDSATRVALANPEWAREKNLVEADEVRANLELLPLLTGRMRVKTLVVEGLRASLEETHDGAVSWSFQRDGAAPAKKPAATEGETATIDIAELHIRKGSILHLVDRGKSAPWQIEEASIVSGNAMHDVVIEARVARNGQPLAIKAQLADLSRAGEADAVTDGKLTLAWAQTTLELAGKIPLSRTLAGAALTAEAKSPSLEDVFAFAGFDRGRSAPFAMKFTANSADQRLRISALTLSLGALDVRGEAQVAVGGKKPTFTARLEADRLDWKKALVDAGGKVRPPRDDGQIYHDDPVAWHALGLLGALDGTADLAVGWLKLGNGVELQKLQATAKMGEGRVALERFRAELLGGSAAGSFRFDTKNKSIQANLDGDNLLLARWFAERGRKLSLEGGPMTLKASLALAGATFRDLAASVKGRVTLRMGRAVWKSPRAEEIEDMMVNAFAPKDAGVLTFECAAAKLDFERGRASGRRIVGARSDASQVLTSGEIDFREERLDLRGRVQAKKGVSLGLANLASGIQVTGRLAHPKVGMDPGEKPAVLARAAAAIATSGATLLGEALLDAASKEDACAAVFK